VKKDGTNTTQSHDILDKVQCIYAKCQMAVWKAGGLTAWQCISLAPQLQPAAHDSIRLVTAMMAHEAV